MVTVFPFVRSHTARPPPGSGSVATLVYASIAFAAMAEVVPVFAQPSPNGAPAARLAVSNQFGTAPLAPPGCIAETLTFTSTEPPRQIVETTPLTSTLTVDSDAYTWDVDLQTDIQHTFNADLDVTVRSPLGTEVTLSTDNGNSGNNGFDGTVWDDDAGDQNPPGAVTEAMFVDGISQSPLVAEEALGAFIGEDPNGDWELQIIDDGVGDTGVLNGWTLRLTALAVAPVAVTISFGSNDTPLAINDVDITVSNIPVAGLDTFICDVNVNTDIEHDAAGDLYISLASPAGTEITLSAFNGAVAGDVFGGTLWDDDAGDTNPPGAVSDTTFMSGTVESPLVPEEALAAFHGENPNGQWTLEVFDDTPGDTGNLQGWSLEISTCACVAPPSVTPTGTPSRTATTTATQTVTPTPSLAPSATPVPTAPPTPTTTVAAPSRTPTQTATPSGTRTRSRTPTRTRSASQTATGTPSRSQTATATRPPTATETSTRTSTPAPSNTATGVPPTVTPTLSPLPTITATSTQTVTPTRVSTPTATASLLPTPTSTALPECGGDCDRDLAVTVDELLLLINIALGNTTVMACPSGDASGDSQITVDEILVAVTRALRGCDPAAVLRAPSERGSP